MSTPAVDRINALQRRIVAGEEPTIEEMHDAIHALRLERGFASEAKATKVAKQKAVESIDIAALFAPRPTTPEDAQ